MDRIEEPEIVRKGQATWEFLERRREWLMKRIQQRSARSEDFTFDEAEMVALKDAQLAIDIAEEVFKKNGLIRACERFLLGESTESDIKQSLLRLKDLVS